MIKKTDQFSIKSCHNIDAYRYIYPHTLGFIIVRYVSIDYNTNELINNHVLKWLVRAEDLPDGIDLGKLAGNVSTLRKYATREIYDYNWDYEKQPLYTVLNSQAVPFEKMEHMAPTEVDDHRDRNRESIYYKAKENQQ